MPKLAAPAARALVLVLLVARSAVEKEARRVVLVPAVEEVVAAPKTTTAMALVDAAERAKHLRQPRLVDAVERARQLRQPSLVMTASAAAAEALLLMLPKDC